MSDGLSNTGAEKKFIFSKGMVKDTADIYMDGETWTNAINAINNSHQGETGTLSNEPANSLSASAPYTIIGAVHRIGYEWVICSTNDIDSEIGIFNENQNTYTPLVNDKCLGFKRTHLITGVVKKNYDCTDSFYFQDNLNPDRTMNLVNIPWLCVDTVIPGNSTCYTCDYVLDDNGNKILDCEKLRLHSLVDQPCVTVSKSLGGGQLNNGSYMACVAYSENGVRMTDYSIPSQPQALWGHTGIGGAIDITIDNLDPDFEEYELVVIAVINQQTIAKKIGNYSIRQRKVSLDLYNQSLPTVELAQIPLRNTIYEKSEKMFEVGNYLIRTGVTTQPHFNYQPLANQIRSEWVSVEYPQDYYWKGGNVVGYMRDEVYAFFIRFVYNTGARSASYHIPGRAKRPNDAISTATADVVYSNEVERWQVYDTASSSPYNTGARDGGIAVAKGDMGYWESTERYPDDQPDVWGSLCGKPIRHHKMPSNERTHIHNNNKIYVLGVQFNNIQFPLDEFGNPIKDIVGYEILRGSREGNRSVVAKGMFNNMWEYEMEGSANIKGLYQNYPYNDLRPDKFLTTDRNTLLDGSGSRDAINNAPAPTTYRRDIYSFHSPETAFTRPYISDQNYIKIYTEEQGIVRGNFEIPFKHPKHKIFKDTAFGPAMVVGAGLAILAAVGKSTSTGGMYVGPQWALAAGNGGSIPTPNPYFNGSRDSGAASAIPDLINTTAEQVSSIGGSGASAATVAGLLLMGAQLVYFYGQGVDQVLTAMYNMAKFRDFMLQYNSHGFYDRWVPVNNSAAPTGATSIRRKIATNGAKYIGSGVQDLDASFRINNLNRNKYLAVHVTQDIVIPTSWTDDTRKRVTDVSSISHKRPHGVFTSQTCAYYGAVKVDYQNQYGQLAAVVQLPTDSCVIPFAYDAPAASSTPIIFGGDTYINRYTEKNPFYFFNTWLMGEPNGTEFDYRNYINGPVPRYWVDFNRYDITDLNFQFSMQQASLKIFGANLNLGKIKPHLSFGTPSDFHRFDRPSVLGTGAFMLRNCWAYLFYNGVRDFYAESELNMAYRDYGENDTEKFYDVYGGSFNDLGTMFRSDKITASIYHKYDLSLSTSKLFNNFASWGSILPADYNPQLYSTCFEYYPDRAIYSLQHQSGLKRDNWRNFLPLNYKDFGSKISTIKSLNQTGAVILFENKEPVVFTGVDQLQTTGGVKITVGDGGLFQQNMQSMVNADDSLDYASCISSRSAVNTPYGLFWISQNNGKIMHYAGGVDEISRNGMKFWFADNLPSKLLKAAPTFPLYDNPVAGIGCQTIYDSQYELVYFSKKDLLPLRSDLHYDDPSGVPYYICGEDPPAPVTHPAPAITDATGGQSPTTSCSQPIDLAIVFDVTASMGTPLDSLKSSMSSLITQVIAKSGNDYRLALITVNEPTGGTTDKGGVNTNPYTNYVQVACSFSPNNYTTFMGALTPLTASGGGATPDPTDLGLLRALNGDAGTWRTGARRMMIMVTDALNSGGDDVYAAADTTRVNTIASQAGVAGVYIYPITTGVGVTGPNATTIATNHQRYVDSTGGMRVSAADGNISSALTEIMNSVVCAPTCNLSASATAINDGQFVTLIWDTTGSNNVTLTYNNANNTAVTVPFKGSAVVYPSATKTYTLVATNSFGSSTCNITIHVSPLPTRVRKCPCEFDNPECFKPCGWTASYDPKSKTWVSFHSWVPDLMIGSHQHFHTIKGNGIWKHNDRWDLYAQYYGVNYAWEVEFPVVTPTDVTTLRSVEYVMEAYKFYNEGKDFHHVLDETFDSATIFNSEQNSGNLNLRIKAKNAPLQLLNYPQIGLYGIDILVSKEENKYRFNTFWDSTNDRGEFSLAQTPMWITSCNGYQRTVNPSYINYNKSPLERKKFRHFGNRIILRKTVSGDRKMILKLGTTKLLKSSR